MQLHMQAAGQCQIHAKPGGGDITSKHEAKSLANQKPEDEWKWHIVENGLVTTTNGVMC